MLDGKYGPWADEMHPPPSVFLKQVHVKRLLTMHPPSSSVGGPSANSSAISYPSPLVIGSLAYERIGLLTTPTRFF